MSRKAATSAPATQALVQRAQSTVRANREEATRLVAFVRERMGEIAAGFYDIGDALGKLRQRALYSSLGHDTFDALLASMSFSKAQAYRFMNIADHMTRERATELGPRRAVALLRLTSATPGEDTVDEVLRRGVTLPGRKEPLPLSKLTVEQIEDAARTLTRAHRAPSQRVSAPDYEAALDHATAIREHLHAAGHTAARVTIQRRGRREQREALMLRIDVPYEARAALPAALRARLKK